MNYKRKLELTILETDKGISMHTKAPKEKDRRFSLIEITGIVELYKYKLLEEINEDSK